MKKFMCIAAIMLMGMYQNLFAQTSESDYSLKGLAKLFATEKLTAYDFKNGFAKVHKQQNENILYGLINKQGEIILPWKYRIIDYFSRDGLIAVLDINWKWGYADKKGNIVIPCQYHDYGSRGTGAFSEGLAAVYLDKNTACYINEKGEIAIQPFSAYRAGEFHGGIAAIRKDREQTYYINKQGNVVSEDNIDVPLQTKNVDNVSEDLSAVKKEGKWGFINKEEQIVIPYKYERVQRFSEGLAAVCINDKWGFVNTSGELIIACQYDRCEDFHEGYAVVKKGNQYAMIDKQGQYYIQFGAATFISSFSDGLAKATVRGIDGYVDKNGRSTFNYIKW